MGSSFDAPSILIQYLWILQGTAKYLYVTKRHEPIFNSIDENCLLSHHHRVEICSNSKMCFVNGIGSSQYSCWVYFLDIYRNMSGYMMNLVTLIQESVDAQIVRVYSDSGKARLLFRDLLKAILIFWCEQTTNELLKLSKNRLFLYVILSTQF